MVEAVRFVAAGALDVGVHPIGVQLRRVADVRTCARVRNEGRILPAYGIGARIHTDDPVVTATGVLHVHRVGGQQGAGRIPAVVAGSVAAEAGIGWWQLFRDREPATPVLALERFATLDATITTTAERIDVRIPIGRRHADLLAHGYLTAIPDVPWLGRVVHISGG